MDPVALAATIGGSLVGLAGVSATAWGAKQQRESATELETSRQTHEQRMASGARLFEKRSDVYERMIGVLHRWTEQVHSTEPILKMANDPEPPEEPSADEQRDLLRVLRTFGSQPVADAYEEFVKAVRSFFYDAMTLRTIRESRGDAKEPWERVEASRQTVRDELQAIERLVSEELASL
jgi:hypothetical protein